MPVTSPPSLMQIVLNAPLPQFVALSGPLKCVVCHNLLKDPWQTECGHRMCFTCMDGLLVDVTEVMCPANEADCEMIAGDKMFYDRDMCREILSQQVYCTYKDAGCAVVVKWLKLANHLESCEFITVECPFKNFGCTEKVPKNSWDEHVKCCKYVPVPCDHCHKDVGSVLRQVHIEKDCPKVVIECPYGCREKTLRNQMEMHKQSCVMRPQQCQYHFIGCTFEGSDSEVSTHELTAHQEHFDFLVKRVEEDDLKRTRLETRLEEQTNENESIKRQLIEANRKITQLEERVTAVQGEVERLKAEHETFATRIEQERHIGELSEQGGLMQGRYNGTQETGEVEQSSDVRVGGLSGETLREMEATSQQVGVHDIRLAEMDVRFQCLEAANYEGVLLWKGLKPFHDKVYYHRLETSNYESRVIWKAMDYAHRKQDAIQNGVMSLYSQPFYTSRCGYKMCGCVCLNGDGMGKGTHLSLFFVLMRGEYDALLEWPFRQKVTLSLLDQSPARRDLSDTFRPDPTSSSFRRPSTEMNIASGCPMFISHNDLQNSRFLQDDTLYMKVDVNTVGLVPR